MMSSQPISQRTLSSQDQLVPTQPALLTPDSGAHSVISSLALTLTQGTQRESDLTPPITRERIVLNPQLVQEALNLLPAQSNSQENRQDSLASIPLVPSQNSSSQDNSRL